MANARPDLSAAFDIFGVEALVTLPGGSPDATVATRALEIAPFVEPFPANDGNWSMTKSRRRFALRLAALGVSEILFGTQIVMGTLTVKVEATEYQDNEVAYVLVR